VNSTLLIATILALLYGLFLLWYGGRGRPLSETEIVQFENELGALTQGREGPPAQALVRALAVGDDGREFVMHNLVRYRAKARYPAGRDFGDSARAADRRYGRAVLWPLLRSASVPVFLAKCTGRFIAPEGTPAWDYVAMVRYRSRRDFLRFALVIEGRDIAVHKWAAIEETQITPLKPIVSLIFVRGAVAVLFALLGAGLYGAGA
jgi:hypothetical protein